MKVLVTGGTGVVGPEVVWRLLRRGHGVRLLSRHASGHRRSFEGDVEAFDADIGDASSVRGAAEGCDAVIHLAAVVAERPPAVTFERVNVEGTRNVVAEAERARVQRLVHVSSLGADRGASAYRRAAHRAGARPVPGAHAARDARGRRRARGRDAHRVRRDPDHGPAAARARPGARRGGRAARHHARHARGPPARRRGALPGRARRRRGGRLRGADRTPTSARATPSSAGWRSSSSAACGAKAPPRRRPAEGRGGRCRVMPRPGARRGAARHSRRGAARCSPPQPPRRSAGQPTTAAAALLRRALSACGEAPLRPRPRWRRWPRA
ncbi:NAD-dependent epimerase/dehydratase family protein [Sorangium sp. So ce1036]|uniref:NAD-dependent epimerase/dehydratase family protein n=1 Tax=Sorangium sp. So ce1036 TaxID=3133328 RepID=UPI003F524D3C